MASLSPFDMPSSPVMKRRQRGAVKKVERACCLTLTYLPLVFVYGLTTWAVWVETSIGFLAKRPPWTGISTSLLGLALYLLLAWSYTVAVFVDPGSPISSKGGYSHLPTQEAQHGTSLTVKSTGGVRFCKKCQARKPDRAHHCSTCQRCVLKMDHHCPWLATCLGLRNYKAFVLFLIYTTLFCVVCFAVSMGWIYSEILSDGQYSENLMPVNYLILAVVSGIFALALGGFTGWHISLAWRNQTTIEKLEKTRYLSTWKNSMHQQHYQQRHMNGHAAPSYREQLREIHTNALPGITRPEEGEEEDSQFSADTSRPTARESLTTNYAEMERYRERERYERYLDEQDSEKLPHAFDLGWRQNLWHLFGDKPLLWFFPICNTIGDGWHWEASAKWRQARDELTKRRTEQHLRERNAGWGVSHERFNEDDDGISLHHGPSPYDRYHHLDHRPPP